MNGHKWLANGWLVGNGNAFLPSGFATPVAPKHSSFKGGLPLAPGLNQQLGFMMGQPLTHHIGLAEDSDSTLRWVYSGRGTCAADGEFMVPAVHNPLYLMVNQQLWLNWGWCMDLPWSTIDND